MRSLSFTSPFRFPFISKRFSLIPPFGSFAPLPNRSHNCGALTSADVDSHVVLAGWLLPERKISKYLSFFPLRDSYGTTQLVVHTPISDPPDARGQQSNLIAELARIPVDSTVLIHGHVRLRPEKQRRPGPAGDIEVSVKNFTLLNSARRHMPFLPSDTQNMANDDLRSQYRYLDLRRPEMSDNLRKRSKVAHIVRTVLNQQDFLEVETPILLKSSPEGAREFLVPTRTTLARGSDAAKAQEPHFFALSQSPQQPKQLLMCSGAVDRYYQIARCFRDEDGRKDRQPEFTQIDLEMAFVSWGKSNSEDDRWRIGGHEVRTVVEDLIRTIWAQIEKISLPDRFDVMTYHEAMCRFGSDKPDTRFALEIVDITSSLPPSIVTALERSEQTICCLPVRQSDDTAFYPIARECPSEDSLDRIEITSENVSSWLVDNPLVREFSPHGGEWDNGSLYESLQLKPGDIVWVGKQRHRPEGGSTTLGRQRLRLAELARRVGHITQRVPRTFSGSRNFRCSHARTQRRIFLRKVGGVVRTTLSPRLYGKMCRRYMTDASPRYGANTTIWF